MIVTESLTINGRSLTKTYSDAGYMIERDGVRYGEAIDPAEFDRTYIETDEPIENRLSRMEYDALNELGVQTDEESNA